MIIFRVPVFRALFRNLALGATFLAAGCWGLSRVEILQFLGAVPGPAVMAAGLLWLLYYALRLWEDSRPVERLLTSVQGPGSELAQKATLHSFRMQEEYRQGGEAEQCFRRGEQCLGEGRYGEAARHYQQSVEAQPSLPTYLNLGVALLNAAEFERAGEALQMGLQVARRTQQRELEAGFQADLALRFLHQGKLEAAQQASQEAAALFAGLGDGRGEAGARLTLGNVHARRGQWDRAGREYAAALKGCEQADDTLGSANVLVNLGDAHAQQEETAEALKHYRTALALHEGLGNLLGQANTLTRIGNAHFRQGGLEEARRVYEAALELYQEVGDPLGQASVLGNIGNVRFRQGKLEEARRQYEQALEIHRERGDALGRAHTLTNIGSLYARQRQWQEALEVLEQARVLFLDAGARGRGLAAVEKLIARLRQRLAKPRRKRGEG